MKITKVKKYTLILVVSQPDADLRARCRITVAGGRGRAPTGAQGRQP
jgi:hypothetical protein